MPNGLALYHILECFITHKFQVFFCWYVLTRWSEKHPLARMVGVKQFDVPKHVLDIVYSQTICWLAVFYAPLFLAATAVKTVFLYCFRMFYIRMAR